MLYHAQSNEKPASVVLTSLPDGSVLVALHDNIQKVTIESETLAGGEQITSIGYIYDEVMFPLPYDRVGTETVQSITDAFESWWTFGEAYNGETPAPTLEERVSILELSLVSLMTQ